MNRKTALRWTAPVLLTLLVLAWAPAAEAADSTQRVKDAIKDGEVDLDLRYRYEAVDQDPIVNDAKASTLRLRLGYGTGEVFGLSAYAGFEALRVIGAERYNSTANGLGSYPVVADPTDEEVNRAYLTYSGLDDTVVRLGRQRIALENQRFIGNVGWRQNEQTFDALTVKTGPYAGFDVFFAHLNNANRVFGEHHPVAASADMNLFGDILQASYKTPAGKFTGYAHFLELEDAPAASHRNIGFRFAGSHSMSEKLDLVYAAEFADQADYKDAPATVDAGYQLVEVGVKVGARWPVTAKLGYELLEGDGTYAFQTPLATLHAFNGWADKFLTTPATGLEDTYLNVSTVLKGTKLGAVYHDFGADFGSADYGSELGVVVARTFRKTYTFNLKYAAYDADTFATDTDKLWLTLQLKL